MRSAEPFSYRQDANVPAFADDKPIIVFDGMCVMCSRFAQIVMRRERVGMPWSLARFGRVLPLGARDWIYGIVARNRLGWFGVRDRCFVPEPEERERFL